MLKSCHIKLHSGIEFGKYFNMMQKLNCLINAVEILSSERLDPGSKDNRGDGFNVL